MAKRKAKKRTSRSQNFATIRVMNPGSPEQDDSHVSTREQNPAAREQNPSAPEVTTPSRYLSMAMRLSMAESNPAVRFITVPVDENGDGKDDLAVVVRGATREEAIRDVANHVDGDAWIDVGLTRSHETKKAAKAHAGRIAPRIEALAHKLSRGES